MYGEGQYVCNSPSGNTFSQVGRILLMFVSWNIFENTHSLGRVGKVSVNLYNSSPLKRCVHRLDALPLDAHR